MDRQLVWHYRFMRIAAECASWSKDRSTGVGAVIVGPDREILATGFNGFPRGCNDDLDSRHERPTKYFWAEHAERNSLYHAARNGTPVKGCTIYVTHHPCTDCARGIIQSGIRRVVLWDECGIQGWGDNQQIAAEMLAECGVETVRLKKPTDG